MMEEKSAESQNLETPLNIEQELKKPKENDSIDKQKKSGKSKSKTTSKVKIPYDLVMVVWDDAAGLRDGWVAKHEEIEPYICISVGFLVRDNGTHYVIAQDVGEDGSHNGRTQIPEGMVKSIRILRKQDNTKSI
jgi:hypothetical protein